MQETMPAVPVSTDSLQQQGKDDAGYAGHHERNLPGLNPGEQRHLGRQRGRESDDDAARDQREATAELRPQHEDAQRARLAFGREAVADQ